MLIPRNRNAMPMLAIGVILLLMIAGVFVNYLSYQYRVVVAGERERLSVTVDYLDTYFNAKLVGLNLLAAYPTVRSFNVERLQPALLTAAKALDVVNISLYDQDGRLISDCYAGSEADKYVFDQPFFKENCRAVLAGYSNISDRIAGNSVEDAYVSLQVPVVDKENVIGVLAAYIPINEVALAVLRESMPDQQYIVVVDGNRQFIYHPRINEFFPENSFFKEQANKLFLDRTGIVDTRSPLGDIDKILVYSSLHNTNWRVAIVIPKYILYARVLSKSLSDAKSFLWLTVCLGLVYGFWRQARRHEREREQLKLERMTCVNQLAAGIAHEIRNPLTSIKGFIQLMARHSDRPMSSEHLEIIISEIARIDSLISEFQVLARPVKEPSLEKIDVCKLLHDVLLLMRGQIHNKSIMLNLELPTEAGFVFGDISQLKQVFINLIKNAIEAVAIGGNVTVALGHQEGKLVVTIEDNGRGISPEIIEKLGTPFFTTKANGTGLGLSVCYSIVQNHGGKILVSSLVDKKTVFSVILPAFEDDRSVSV
ncbi:PAS domain-containing sensor histidine kinase [Sporomusa acidovorans]|uniref:histidine kinase n=1 Tax=Sporomusa acidovorans (strain ATCC 49682 / DSM 3132 / Mol) TaxID=1123286 RepID=A0ABZ3J0D4_SPOA4|nr:PAS domain-containing sensor histidine kinase [Sporomusa acidovorans]OZC24221.1 sporulation kinase A [Sporomusa acidovorans DSM 3132]SDF55725.1 Signal transduction histidine kinase [Sporomusa acidovorans]